MNLEKTRNAINEVFGKKLDAIMKEVLKTYNREEAITYLSQMEIILTEYLRIGGIIETGSIFEESKMLSDKKQETAGGYPLAEYYIEDYLTGVKPQSSICFDEMNLRNSKLSLSDLRKILTNRYGSLISNFNEPMSQKLEYLEEFVRCGGTFEDISKSNDQDLSEGKRWLKAIMQNRRYAETFGKIKKLESINSSDREKEER